MAISRTSRASRSVIGPSPSYLRSRTVFGAAGKWDYKFIGETNDSPGSDLIVKLAEEEDERPIWVQAWGGGNHPGSGHLARAERTNAGATQGLP